MIDILVYLFETYGHIESCPEPEQLARKLSAAGFEDDEIGEAMEWFSGLRKTEWQPMRYEVSTEVSIRVYAQQEEARLDTQCRGFVLFLENAGLLDAHLRELIIERAMALPEGEITLAKFKIIALMVLWQQRATVDALMLGELLSATDEENEEWDMEGALPLH